MIIRTDEEGKNAILGLLDCALKAGGLQNKKAVDKVEDAIEAIEEKGEQ